MNWDIIQVLDLTQTSQYSSNKQPIYAPPIPVKPWLIKVKINSQSAINKPNWIAGANVKWAYLSDFGLERFVGGDLISVDVNTTTTVEPPRVLKNPLLILEIPYWLRDATAFIWQLRNLQDTNEMPFSIPPITPAAQQPHTSTVPKSSIAVNKVVDFAVGDVEVVPVNLTRVGLTIKNSGASAVLIRFGDSGSFESETYELQPNSVWESADFIYTGLVLARWSNGAAGDKLDVAEFSA